MSDSLLLVDAPSAGLRLAVCVVPALARDASRRHGLASGSASALGQALAGTLLLAATEGTDREARVDVQLECAGPLRGLLVDATASGAVRGLVRVAGIDRAGRRLGEAGGPSAGDVAGASGPGLERFDAGPVLVGNDDTAGKLIVVRAVPGGRGEVHRAQVPFTGADLGAGITTFLRADRSCAGEMALEVLHRPGEPLAAVAGVLVLPLSEESEPDARDLGPRLRSAHLREALLRAEATSAGNSHLLAQELASSLDLGPVRLGGEVRPRFQCRCSRERVVRALSTLGREELRDMAGKDGGATASCDFCAATYTLSAAELLQLAGEEPAQA